MRVIPNNGVTQIDMREKNMRNNIESNIKDNKKSLV